MERYWILVLLILQIHLKLLSQQGTACEICEGSYGYVNTSAASDDYSNNQFGSRIIISISFPSFKNRTLFLTQKAQKIHKSELIFWCIGLMWNMPDNRHKYSLFCKVKADVCKCFMLIQCKDKMTAFVLRMWTILDKTGSQNYLCY